MIGDKRKFCSALVTLKTAPNADGTFSVDLLPEALAVSPASKTSTAAAKDPAWHKYIQAAIDEYNKRAVSHAQKIQKFVILEHDLSVPGGELGPTLKLKRNVVADKYESVIDGMYPKE